jgi:hypothetical protein
MGKFVHLNFEYFYAFVEECLNRHIVSSFDERREVFELPRQRRLSSTDAVKHSTLPTLNTDVAESGFC